MKKNLLKKNIFSKELRIFRSSKKVGLPPGSVVYTGVARVDSVRLFVTDYSAEKVQRREISSLNDLAADQNGIRWISVQGLHETELLQQIGKKYDIHPLVLEDIVNTNQPPKIEEFEDYVFVIFKMLMYDSEEKKLFADHISIVLKDDLVISFQETHQPYFDPVLKRLENPKARLRKFGADYLLYGLLDLIVDHYFVAIEMMEDQFESIEDAVMNEPHHAHVEDIHRLKRQVIAFRKAVRPLREVVNLLSAEEITLMTESISVYLRDLYDHTIQVADSLEALRDLATGLMDTYLSQVSNRMNEVMKVLTIMSTIFIPLGFLAGLYGMNFQYMPELQFRYSYFILLGFMAIAIIGMILFFRHKKWI